MGNQWLAILKGYPFHTEPDGFVNANTGATIYAEAVKEHCNYEFYGRVILEAGGKTHVIWADDEGHRRNSLSNEMEIEAARQQSLIKATERMIEIVARLNGGMDQET